MLSFTERGRAMKQRAPDVVLYAFRAEQHLAQSASVRLLIRDVDAGQLRTTVASALLVLMRVSQGKGKGVVLTYTVMTCREHDTERD